MKRASPSLQFVADAVTITTANMSSRPCYRGRSRGQWRRGLSDRTPGDVDDHQFTGASHFRSVRDANLGFQPSANRGNLANHRAYRPHSFNPRAPPFNPPPPLDQNIPSRAWPPPHFYQNQPRRPPHQFHPRPPKPLDYRDWEYAKPGPPSNCDYLAINHRSKLYFHIPHHILDWEWRKRSILFELGLWSSDILCFQEVDRFQDLEEELKLRGYAGIWKMRTGDPVDGCAIFWRLSRFKLLHEESIEFSKLGLRDNVAQICVLESMNQNDNMDKLALPASSSGSKKVVICNIHVLFNPKRGEIKLAQIRVLTERAYAVSRLWNAPVVLCGDFNCTPKSPLYSFILEQKLNLLDIPRDKVSGQTSAEIRQPRPFIRNIRAPTENIVQMTIADGVGQSESSLPSNMEKQNGLDKISETTTIVVTQGIETVPDLAVSSCINSQADNEVSGLCHGSRNSNLGAEDGFKDATGLPDCCSTISSSSYWNEDGSVTNQMKNRRHEFTTSDHINVFPCEEKELCREDSCATPDEPCCSESNLHAEQKGLNCKKAELFSICERNNSADILHPEPAVSSNSDASLSELLPYSSVADVRIISPPGSSRDLSCSTLYEVEYTSESSNLDIVLNGKMEKLALDELVEATNEEYKDSPEKSVDVPHGPELSLPSDEILNDSPDTDFELVDPRNIAYDPSAWTPMEIETATGSSDCTVMEHPLKLRSTYTEVEDSSGTRDSNAEPQVTSYHKCFLGTVDYIWRSEGLQTVKVLAPIPKHAMQWTSGFPTKKWGSDHVALVSELAFTRDITTRDE